MRFRRVLLQQISMQWFTHKGRIHMDGLHSKYKYAEKTRRK